MCRDLLLCSDSGICAPPTPWADVMTSLSVSVVTRGEAALPRLRLRSSFANGRTCLLSRRSRRSPRSASRPLAVWSSLAVRPRSQDSVFAPRSQTEERVCSLVAPDGAVAPPHGRSRCGRRSL
ncbi:hypothetical protein MLP_26130 [Microlunatus phosphovorus NM-1]|uniref:Uncharacterized protein n=1 Tax=Microlunatus phosphovorus (strain ATCC 700054 / DSM 10555 / JCM 9379 / NBRC 101784 / NCIMB 13414 / VKM Ac-1990 / NM-1) TaxID=1032480 RepID=F5XGZ5_MICPN|nr:hypothetical protein MLP_26130 [Microlunatus phosphovorus NM-1]